MSSSTPHSSGRPSFEDASKLATSPRKSPPSPLPLGRDVTRPIAATDKGKGRAEPRVERTIASPGSNTLSSMLDDAMNSPLPAPSPAPSVDSSFRQPSPISAPPRAHYPSTLSAMARPRLLSQLTRSTLPTASLTYAAGEHEATGQKERSVSLPDASGTLRLGETSTAWRKSESSRTLDNEPFPDLDPTTGLPLGTFIDGADPETRSLHLQRTITDILASSSTSQRRASTGTVASYLPSLPSLPAMPGLPNIGLSIPRVKIPALPGTGRSSLDLKRTDSGRSISSIASQNQDWGAWAAGWWSGNKDKVDKMMSEDDQADTIEEEREKHRRKYKKPKSPLVFCHGLLGFDFVGPTSLPSLQISHWRGIREVLEANGVEVLITRVPATASIADRAAILDEVISEKYPGQEINLIGHSMGGLDCRYLTSEIRPTKYKPVTVTTISTPHRGSPFADYVIDNVVGRDRLPALLKILESMRLPQSGDGSAFASLGTKSMKEFNRQVADHPDVKYYSWGATFDPGLLDTFKWPHSVILAKEGANDGLVSVESAKWGEYRGTLVGVNHLDLVGWVNTMRYAIAGWTGRPITFKPATFYLEISDYLAEQGF